MMPKKSRSEKKSGFHFEFKKDQEKVWAELEKNDISFLIGPAGTAKTFLSCAYAIKEIYEKKKSRIIISRPVVEAGENLGFLPGSFSEKLSVYVQPIYDCISKIVGYEGPTRERINRLIEIAPIAYLRGRTFSDAVCILDEAQNASRMQLLLFLTRMGENCKILVTGDPTQSDLRTKPIALQGVVDRLRGEEGIGVIELDHSSIVRHPLVSRVLKLLEEHYPT